MIEIKNLQGYINIESAIPQKKGLLSFLYLMLIICVPTSIFGIYSNVTKIIMLPITVVMILWVLYLLIKKQKSKSQFILFQAIFSTFISLSLLIAAYKIASSELQVPIKLVVLIFLIYIIIILSGMLYTLRLIENGYFVVERKSENPMGVIVTSGFLGLGLGRILMFKTSEDTAVLVLILGIIFLGFLFSIGTHNYIKYYFIKKLK